jgi:hypothetical protein
MPFRKAIEISRGSGHTRSPVFLRALHQIACVISIRRTPARRIIIAALSSPAYLSPANEVVRCGASPVIAQRPYPEISSWRTPIAATHSARPQSRRAPAER